MEPSSTVSIDSDYHAAMSRLLLLYSQVDRLIMEICAARIDGAPDVASKLALAKQVGDECRHVSIQRQWMRRFDVVETPVLTPEQEATICAHFRTLPWLEFLVDLYLCVEALGSEAVEKIVPLADPETRESLRIPLADELDHVAFGVARLKQELAALPTVERRSFVARIPDRIDALAQAFHGFGLDVPALFAAVGADYRRVCEQLALREDELLDELAA